MIIIGPLRPDARYLTLRSAAEAVLALRADTAVESGNEPASLPGGTSLQHETAAHNDLAVVVAGIEDLGAEMDEPRLYEAAKAVLALHAPPAVESGNEPASLPGGTSLGHELAAHNELAAAVAELSEIA